MSVKTPKNQMANLYPRGSVLYMKFTFMGQKVHRSTFTDDPKLAQLAIQKAQKEIYEAAMNTKPKVTVVTFSKAIEEVYAERWSSNNTGSTSHRQAKVALDILGNIPVQDIGTKQVREVQATLRGMLNSEVTVNRYMAAFRTVVLHAAESYGFSVPKFKLTKEATGRIRVYTPEEEAAIIKWFNEKGWPEMADATPCLIDTGFRLTELLSVGKRNAEGRLISEVSLERRTISSWENKGVLPRTIPLTSKAFAILERRGTIPFTYNKDMFDHRWAAMRTALGMDEECCGHVCRHTCASRLLALPGTSLVTLQKWLGHADIKTTMIYAHLAPNALEQARNALEGVTTSVSDTTILPLLSTGSPSEVIKPSARKDTILGHTGGLPLGIPPDSKSSAREGMPVRPRPPAPIMIKRQSKKPAI